MPRSIWPPAQWAQATFEAAELGDQRRTQRLIQMASRLAEHPGGTLPQAFTAWAELKGAYRFLSNAELTQAQLQQPHWEQTRADCRQAGTYLLIEDTMDLDYSHSPAAEDLGFIGDGHGRGIRVHTTLALRIEGWSAQQQPETVVVGLAGQQCYWPNLAPENESRGQRLRRTRQSQRWTQEIAAMGRPPAGCQWIYVADQESDFYEPIDCCQRQGVDFVIRSYQDRSLEENPAHLRQVMAQAPLRGLMWIHLRARPGQAARTATATVRAQSVRLTGPWRPGGWRPAFTLNVVEVKEVNPPPEIEQPLHWVLLTSLPCLTWTEVQRVVGCYTARWLIEEYHKTVQSGTQVEQSQLKRGYRLDNLIAILALVAVRLLSTKLLARAWPEKAVPLEEFGQEARILLSALFGPPEGGWTYYSLFIAVARLGGFVARKGDGMPGWQTIWRGWERLMQMCRALEVLKYPPKGYG